MIERNDKTEKMKNSLPDVRDVRISYVIKRDVKLIKTHLNPLHFFHLLVFIFSIKKIHEHKKKNHGNYFIETIDEK